MKIYTEHTGDIRLTLSQGQQEHLVLINPRQVALQVEQEEASELLVHCISLDGLDGQVVLTAHQVAPRCSTQMYGLGLLRGKQTFDLTTHVFHDSTYGSSLQLFKNILLDEAKGSFYGELKVLPDAQKTEAHQTNRNILLSRSARMNTKPQLEIYADDVKCSHGATTGQLDEQALFYMQQRGISRQTAQRLLLTAFLQDVLNTLPDESLLEQLTTQIEHILA